MFDLKRMSVFISLLGCATWSQADVIGIKASASAWQAQSLGTGSGSDQTAVQLAVAAEHPLPLLPNAKLRYLNESHSRNHNNNLQQIQLQQTDAILYYELLDYMVELDAGVALNHIKGDVEANAKTDFNVSSATSQQNVGGRAEPFSQLRPSLYAAVAAKLPLTHWQIQSEAMYTNSFNTKLRDIQAQLRYGIIDNIAVDFAAVLGYRALNIDFAQARLADSNIELKGPYLGLDAHF